MLEHLKEIRIENPSDQIIRQIKELIISGQLNPGEKLPPERKLSASFGVGRSAVRHAIRKLEFYGIVKTIPQSGTIVEGLGIVALEGLITDVLNIEKKDFRGLVETRVLLEVEAAGRAAERRTAEDLVNLQNALNEYEKRVNSGATAVEEDLLFHIKIAEAAQNSVLKSLMLIITPEIIKNFNRLSVCKSDRLKRVVGEHFDIVNFIARQNADAAREAMRLHLNDVLHFSVKEE